MGLTIFYSGKLRYPELLIELQEEVTDLCNDLYWPCSEFLHWQDIPLVGFQFHPPGSEPLWMTFNVDGELVDPIYYVFEGTPHMLDREYGDGVLSTITQYAGIDAHIELLDMLRYLSRKYFSTFELIDESHYWETGDKSICQDRFDLFAEWMDEMAEKLAKLDGCYGQKGETFYPRMQALMERQKLEEIVRQLNME